MINVSNILALGDDQMASQYSLIFPEGIPGGGTGENVSLRMDQSLDPPEQGVNVYERFHKGFKIPKTGMLEETTKEFTVDVLVDQQWQVYDELEACKKMTYNQEDGTGLPDMDCYFPIITQYEDKQQNSVKQIQYNYCKIKALKVATADNTSGDPLRLTVTFTFVSSENKGKG